MKTVPYTHPLTLRRLGLVDYEATWRDMQSFVEQRTNDTSDEIWLLQHPPVYTQGLSCTMEPSQAGRIPMVHTDRGGQITYHGPGQVIAYVLLDIRRRRTGVKRLVDNLEQAVIDLLAGYGFEGRRRDKAPGVYVQEKKIAALGLRIRRGCSYHGLSLNVDMDLAPFSDIDPCGYEGLEVTQLRDLGVQDRYELVESKLADCLVQLFEEPVAVADPARNRG